MVENKDYRNRICVLNSLSNDLQTFGEISLAVSGSMAYGMVSSDSDIDLIIVIPADDLNDFLLNPEFQKYFFCYSRTEKVITDFTKGHIDAFSVNGIKQGIKLSAYIYSIQSLQKMLFHKVRTIKISKKYQLSKIKNRWFSFDPAGNIHAFCGIYAVNGDALLLTRELIHFFDKTFYWGPDFDRIFMSRFLVDNYQVVTMIRLAIRSLMKYCAEDELNKSNRFLNRFYRVRYFSQDMKQHILSHL
ncbi:hypothetical protein GF337_15835 [candidate division KSB1 bacterium]|nr:hypothetical protein [candidate division KSB1 bacterium]